MQMENGIHQLSCITHQSTHLPKNTLAHYLGVFSCTSHMKYHNLDALCQSVVKQF